MISPPPVKLHRIFLSSTDDPVVREYRSTAKKIIREEFWHKWQPVDIQDINPSDSQPVEVCKGIILSCHVYIGILGAFYGSVNEQENLSYTEYEFKVAKDSQRRVAIFLLPYDFGGVSPDYVVQQGPLLDRQRTFRAYVKSEESGLTVREVSHLEDFKKKLRSFLNTLAIEPEVITIQTSPVNTTFLAEDIHLNYDRRLVQKYKVEHLDDKLINKLLEQPQAKIKLARSGVLQATAEEHLELLGFSHGDRPTLGAFLCFASKQLLLNKFAACSLQTVIYSETRRSRSELPTNEIIEDNLLNLFLIGMQFLTVRAGLKRIGRIGTGGRDKLEIPEIALREALANALMHRDYEDDNCKDQPTRIEVYPNRVEIISYGRVPDGISVDALNQNPESVSPIRRNYVISEIFRIMQYGELVASGIGRIHEATQRASLRLPEIVQETNQHTVKVILYRRPTQPHSQAKIPLSGRHQNVFISSTVRDLPIHRQSVVNACQRLAMFPYIVEQLTINDADAIRTSLEILENADIYVGIFAQRYGYIPEGDEISIAEMEYNRAVERGMPRLVFLMHDDHPVRASDVEMGEGAEKLRIFKERLKSENVVNFFKSPEDLRADVINSLSKLRKPDVEKFHYISEIPTPPEPYIAHPYTLLQSHNFIGRQKDLNLLTDWIAKSDAEIYKARILNIIAIGGMGKSALTWKWFNDIAPQEMKPLKGRVWWSFYESDARYENFVIRTLAYVTKRSREEVQKMPLHECEEQLLAALDNEPFLLVLDGFERLLIAYARMDAAHLSDDDFDEKTANRVATAGNLPESTPQSFTGQYNLRKTADPRVGAFLRNLATRRASRVLITTRLYPQELQDKLTDEAIIGAYPHFLPKLTDDDAINLWRSFEVGGSREELLSLFHTFDNHPLLIKALASEIKRYKRAPGDFEQWRRHHPNFGPSRFPALKEMQAHVLDFALRGLDEKSRKTLHTIAAFRMPAAYETLLDLLVGQGKLFVNDNELDDVLTELEDRALLGWDKRANRYDLHPIVRSVVWSGMGDDTRRGVYTNLYAHLEALPKIDDWHEVSNLEDLTSTIELYNTLIGLGRYDDAVTLFYERLDNATLYRLSASRQRVELLEMLFADGLNQLPRLLNHGYQAYTLAALALGYKLSGEPGRAATLYHRSITIRSEMNDQNNLSVGFGNLSNTLRLSGALRQSEAATYHALVITREQDDDFLEATSLFWLGLTLAARGVMNESEAALQRSFRILVTQSYEQGIGYLKSLLAQRRLWLREFSVALSLADSAWELFHDLNFESHFIHAARVQGEAALGLNYFTIADERLHHALTRARMVHLTEEELPALVALAELRRRQGDLKAARESLDDIWEAAERGPYPLIHADACNVLAQIERDDENQEKAIEAATKAYRLAWCDGPPFAYHWGLEKARRHLRELGAPEPDDLPPFDESKFEPMPEVEIDPEDEFGGQES